MIFLCLYYTTWVRQRKANNETDTDYFCNCNSFLCGCDKKEIEETEETEQRFVFEYRQTYGIGENINIIRDMETGKAYLFVHEGYAGGLTILEEDK